MKAELIDGREYGTDKPCQIGRLTYRVGAHDYVALAFRYLSHRWEQGARVEPPTAWRLTWLGLDGGESSQLPPGISPSDEMLAALAEATEDEGPGPQPCTCTIACIPQGITDDQRCRLR